MAKRLGVPPDDPSVQADLRRLAGGRDATADTPPGWYPFPGEKGYRRWWTGEAWTDRWKDDPAKPPMTTAATIGFFMAVFVPFAGFLMGLALTAARDRHGHWVVVTSMVAAFLAAIALLDSL